MGEAVTETSRLSLERASPEDVAALVGIGTPEVVRFLGGTPWTEASVLDDLALWRTIEDRLGITTWVVRLRETGEVIGICGFAGTNQPWLRFDVVIEVGWTLGRPWWGQGMATEAAQAAIAVGLDLYPRERFIAKCHVDNAASERVMHRMGMRRVGLVHHRNTTIICRFT
jgi:RimJ/RimL family protein N-acetyltransferase